MAIWRTVVGKLWLTIIALVAVVIITVGVFLMQYVGDLQLADTNRIKHLFIYTGVVGFLLTTFFAFFLLTKITQPLREMKEAADRVSQGDYAARVAIRSSDEIGELANTFNQMASELNALIRDLQHERDHLSSVLRSMTDAVISFDADGGVILTNPQGDHLLDEWSAVHWEEEATEQLGLVPVPLRDTFQRVLSTGRELTDKIHVQSGVWSVVMTPLAATDEVRGAVAVFRDVTEEFRIDKMRKDFVANVSHEIRTPLSMVQGYSEALLDDIAGSPEERKELVQVIHDESLRMGRLVKDLLDLARMEAGYLEMTFQPVDVNALMSRVYRKFSVLAKDAGITLTRMEEDAALQLQAADPDRLEQVMTNLLDNAIRHTPSGASIRMGVERKSGSRGPVLELTVEDEGQGIPPEDLPYIFERFYKADKARKRETKGGGGTGLGLAIVKNLVEAHGGKIRAESEPGRGTRFTISLPMSSKRATTGSTLNR
ncbi:cell wall metabolism sensor histidine kinase WalK [Cohnella pontilimi]|uniref:histidine kinase n=1 Tax=Cohnella pontilimi TaxID=2564100 RepID=A0A4V5LST7_9BACL|nr:ATP-binding protein [Cohnella pontilimi]TJY44379.1 cell wall metabolism sensor histidine kinase WalK [Cohnella pontilimi]